MIRKLQKKFISITAAALFAMILFILAAINCVFFLHNNKMLDMRLEQIMRGQVLDFRAPGDGRHFPGAMPFFEDRLLMPSDDCLIFLDENGVISEILQDGAGHYSQEELADIAEGILADGKTRGWHQYFKYAVEPRRLENGKTGAAMGLINASSSLYSIFTMLLISTVIGLMGFILVLLIIILASGRAVKPMAESYLKQKQFVTNAGHELKTPLTVISANNELLRMTYGDSDWSDGIDRQVAKMNGLVRSLITLAKMDEEQKPVFTVFNLSDAVYDTAKSFENLIHSQGKLISFDIAEDVSCLGDESKLRQTVSILMDNAVKYCDEKGKVAVRLKSDRHIRLQVINDCAGTEGFEPEKVFERFYRADKARTSDGSYGLGLSIAKSIVELHKGEIHARVLEHSRVMFEVLLKPAKNP